MVGGGGKGSEGPAFASYGAAVFAGAKTAKDQMAEAGDRRSEVGDWRAEIVGWVSGPKVIRQYQPHGLLTANPFINPTNVA